MNSTLVLRDTHSSPLREVTANSTRMLRPMLSTNSLGRLGQRQNLSAMTTTSLLDRSPFSQRINPPQYEYRSFSSRPNLRKVLVANRGEIACRVIRTCRRLGIPTVAIYSNADGPNALHAQMADESYLIGSGPTPQESYLLADEILKIAQHSDVQAIHPGYGFLSENASFCAKLEQMNDGDLCFIGPPSTAITAMGSKSQSKAIMDDAGVPTTPGHYGDDRQDGEYLLQKAREIGFPLLIKAVSGGGGKGMRLVHHESEFLAALESCQRESMASFGDANVLLEKYLVDPRHVEVQIVADTHGNIVHLYERDCSLQRRHQKIIEEAPASDLDPQLRHRLGEMGKRAAQAVGYVNAGTVEFLLDTHAPDQFYFCEMNTRLQVEHPITEQITGVDLVEWQLRIAAGEELPIKSQEDIPCIGHAFEARIYAENPARNFLPATGTVWHHEPPAPINTGLSPENGVRVDTGLQAGQDVGVYYDPMISKLITHGDNRRDALQKLIMALKNYQLAGVPSNIEFLVKCAEHPTFGVAGAINTGFLDDYADDVRMEEDEQVAPIVQAVGSFATMLYLEKRIGSTPGGRSVSPWSSHSGSWRMGGELGRATRVLTLPDGGSITCISNPDGSFEFHTAVDDGSVQVFHVSGNLASDGEMEVLINGTERVRLSAVLNDDGKIIHVRMWPKSRKDFTWKLDIQHPLAVAQSDKGAASAGQGSVKSPMPGKIKLVNKVVGDEVAEGDVVIVMEAMKMEHAIKAPHDGVVVESPYKTGDVVDDGVVLFCVDSGDLDGGEVEMRG